MAIDCVVVNVVAIGLGVGRRIVPVGRCIRAVADDAIAADGRGHVGRWRLDMPCHAHECGVSGFCYPRRVV